VNRVLCSPGRACDREHSYLDGAKASSHIPRTSQMIAQVCE
jgi:hypothetical protein